MEAEPKAIYATGLASDSKQNKALTASQPDTRSKKADLIQSSEKPLFLSEVQNLCFPRNATAESLPGLTVKSPSHSQLSHSDWSQTQQYGPCFHASYVSEAESASVATESEIRGDFASQKANNSSKLPTNTYPQSVTLLAAITTSEIIGAQVIEGGVDAARFSQQPAAQATKVGR